MTARSRPILIPDYIGTGRRRFLRASDVFIQSKAHNAICPVVLVCQHGAVMKGYFSQRRFGAIRIGEPLLARNLAKRCRTTRDTVQSRHGEQCPVGGGGGLQ